MSHAKDRDTRPAQENDKLLAIIRRHTEENKSLMQEIEDLARENSELKKRNAEQEREVGGNIGHEAVIKELMRPENRAGVGPYLGRVNHIALIVSDVGRSTEFYSKILGLPQINRPNFDRHGAWFTWGNVELHLIKGQPVVHDGSNLIVAHLAIESDNIEMVYQKLLELGIEFEQNVSVPSTQEEKSGLEKRSRVVAEDAEKMAMGAVTQYFFRDPDGYYLELCNCDILTEFCLSKSPYQMDYVEGVMNPEKIVARGAFALRNWMDQSQGKTTTTLHDVFKMMDKDNSGQIEASELIKIFQDFGQTGLKKLETLQKFQGRKISYKEFKILLLDERNFENELRGAFKLFDKDNTGFLTAAEVRHVLTSFNLHLRDDETDRMITKADLDGDGQVNIDEFLCLIGSGSQKLESKNSYVEVDSEIFENLKRRRGIYGDIVQSVESDEVLKTLLLKFGNSVPLLINHLQEKYKHSRVFSPPAYLKSDGGRFEPKAIHITSADSGSEGAMDHKHENEELTIDSSEN